MAKEIQLTQGKVAIVDDEDFDYINQFKWFADRQKNNKFYAVNKSTKINNVYRNIKMHRLILRNNTHLHTDHINGDTLDNRRCNLRICTAQQNSCNKPKNITNKSGYKGVFYNKKSKMYVASIKHNYKNQHLGCFYFAKQAAKAYNLAAQRLHGEFANLNKID